MKKYIDADKLKVKIDSFRNSLWKVLPNASNVENGELSIRQASDLGAYKALESVIYMIDSLQQEQPEVVEGIVHHYATVHYINTNTKQLNARLKQFPEGAEVEIYIQRKEG